jgi:peroxiredoxin
MLPGFPCSRFRSPEPHGAHVRLSDFLGKEIVVVAFHPLAFTPVCAAQMQTYEMEKSRFDALGAHLLSISVDADRRRRPGPSHLAVSRTICSATFIRRARWRSPTA